MAKGTADDGGAATGAGQEKAAGKGAGDVPAAAAAAGDEELVIRAPVHCDGCGRKLRHSLQRLEGVEKVTVDSRTNTVVVRGGRAVENATEVLQLVQRKTREKAVLVSPSSPDKLPPPPPLRSAPKGGGGETNDMAKDVVANDELSEEVDMEMVTVLKMNLHCDACSEEIKRRIIKITGVDEAVPHLKSSQVMVKGKVEPATLVGFIHKCTGRRAAIIRAEPLDDLLRPANSPAPPPPVEAESKKDEPSSENPPPGEEEKNGGEKKEEPNEENNEQGGGGAEEEDNNADESPETEKPSDGGGHGGEAPNHDDGGGHGDGLVLENHTKDDRLFTVPMPAGVVTVAPEMAALSSSRSYCYYPAYPSYPQYCYSYQQYHQYPQQPYSPAYAMYGGYGYPANYPSEAFCEENPNACTIV